jgi:glycosyltransferase involved in cell wall biosynthesis
LEWLAYAANRTPNYDWLFVGDVETSELLDADRPHLDRLRELPNCIFAGAKPYKQLQNYACRLDVALLPYSDRSVNPSACPMRLYVHLAYGQPILATPGCDMLEEMAPLVAMCASPDDLVQRLRDFEQAGFDDGLWERRWREAASNTWTLRAEQLLERLAIQGTSRC